MKQTHTLIYSSYPPQQGVAPIYSSQAGVPGGNLAHPAPYTLYSSYGAAPAGGYMLPILPAGVAPPSPP